jgi:hypothetical protein
VSTDDWLLDDDSEPGNGVDSEADAERHYALSREEMPLDFVINELRRDIATWMSPDYKLREFLSESQLGNFFSMLFAGGLTTHLGIDFDDDQGMDMGEVLSKLEQIQLTQKRAFLKQNEGPDGQP